MENTRAAREKEFHNKRFSKEVREPTVKYYKITNTIHEDFKSEIFNKIQGAKILELGCSKGYFSIEMAKKGAKVTGIDISEIAIQIAKESANESDLSEKCDFLVKDASQLDFPPKSFDKVVGGAILHHLDFENALKSICRILKTEGQGIFLEPLGFNPLINLYRKFTPKFRTPDEKPLTQYELEKLHKYFKNVEIKPYYLTTLLAVPFANMSNFNQIVRFLNNIDQKLFKIRFFRKYAWQILIKVSSAKENFS